MTQPRLRPRTQNSLPICCCFRTMDDTGELNLSAKQRRDRTLEALTKQIEALARLNPVLMIFEDAHWADPTSLEASVSR